ncbi:MAG: metallophosphoesterase family protein, partial [Nanoarchaeota archaeon]
QHPHKRWSNPNPIWDTAKIFITHYPLLAKPMAKSGEYDAVFYGHDHVKNMDKIKDCIIVNPGEISAHKTGIATFAMYDTKTNTAEIIELKKTVTTKTKDVTEHFDKMNFSLNKSKDHAY